DADIRVTGPGGFNVLAKFKGFTSISGGVSAKYEITPPGGNWDLPDAGSYAVSLEANQVLNTPNGKGAPAVTLGTFSVAIPRSFVVVNTNDSGPGSLRQAVMDANAVVGATDSITFDPTVFSTPQTIALTSGEIGVTDSVTIVGPGAGLLTIDAGGK